jgi:shikimate kinase
MLGRRLDLPCIDLDFEIEKKIDCSIKSFFQKNGEAQFRNIESLVLKDVLSSNGSFVLATGGGVVLKEDNRLLLLPEYVVYLSSLPGDLLKRVGSDDTRPLLQTDDLLVTLSVLFQTRHPLYELVADFVIATSGKSASKLTDEIISGICL